MQVMSSTGMLGVEIIKSADLYPFVGQGRSIVQLSMDKMLAKLVHSWDVLNIPSHMRIVFHLGSCAFNCTARFY